MHYGHQYNITIGDDICREEILESHKVIKCFIPNLTTNKLNPVKRDQDQELPDEEHSPEVQRGNMIS